MRKLILILFIGLLASCSTENEELLGLNKNNSELENALKNTNLGVINYENKTAIIKNKHEVMMFTNSHLAYQINYSNMDKIEVISNDTTQDEVKIINSRTNEFMKFKNVVYLEDASIVFDLETSTGLYYESITYKSNSAIEKCPWCWVVPVITKAITDILEDDYDSNCASAIESCGSAGVDSVEIVDGGWFGESSCTVTCK